MNRQVLVFIALALSMIYGVLFAVIDGDKTTYAVVGGVIVALAWVAVGMFGNNRRNSP